MRSDDVLFGFMISIVGALLVLTGGGCAVFFLPVGFHDMIGGLFLAISLVVFLVGGALICAGVQIISHDKNDPSDAPGSF